MSCNGTQSSACSLKKALVREGSVVVGEDKTNEFAGKFLVLVKIRVSYAAIMV